MDVLHSSSRSNSKSENLTVIIKSLRKRIEELESNNSLRLPSSPSSINSNNQYAVLFLDGDHDIFDSRYIKNGYQGGKSAANDLKEKTLFYLSKEYGIGLNDIEVLVYNFMNLNGLKGFLHGSQGIPFKIVDEFFRGFNSSPFPFAAIDCGSTSQAADQSLLNWIPHHLQQDSCRYVFLGGLHDKGYAPMIHKLPVDQRKKVTLLRTSPRIAYQFTVLNLPKATFSGLFHAQREGNSVDQIIENGTCVSPRATSLVYTNVYPVEFLAQAIHILSPAGEISEDAVRKEFFNDLQKIYLDTRFPDITNFRTLCEYAAVEGIIICGGGKTNRWLSLAKTLRSTSTKENVVTPIASVSIPVASISTTSSSVATTTIRADNPPLIAPPTPIISRNPYIPLVLALQSFPLSRSSTESVALHLAEELEKVYSDPIFPRIIDFESYCKEAESAGYVQLGIEANAAIEWILLSPVFCLPTVQPVDSISNHETECFSFIEDFETSVSASATDSRPATPPNFTSNYPNISTTADEILNSSSGFSALISVLSPYQTLKMPYSIISDAVNSLDLNRNVYGAAGTRNWDEYISKAIKFGIVTIEPEDIDYSGVQLSISLNTKYYLE